MTDFFHVEMLPAVQGDCLWVEYGDADNPHRVLIDGGTKAAFPEIKRRIKRLPEDQRRFELLVITHVDQDHIEGVVKLLQDERLGVAFGDVWFNGWRHLSDIEEFGPVDGEILTSILLERRIPWNQAADKKAIAVAKSGPLPAYRLAGGLTTTVLSPDRGKLAALKPVWEQACRDAGIDPHRRPGRTAAPSGLETLGPLDPDTMAAKRFSADDKEANGSSIALVLEYQGKSLLLTGDAHPDLLLISLDKFTQKTAAGRAKIDACKLPHHGSNFNISREFLEKVACNNWLVSTNGAKYRHPNREALAKIIKYGGDNPRLIFNYRTEYNSVWEDMGLMRRYRYAVSFPATAEPGNGIDLLKEA